MHTFEIAPSALSADFSDMQRVLKETEAAGVKTLHLDVMDGHFVPNLTFGAPIIKAWRPHTKLIFDAHLMVTNPADYIAPCQQAGVDWLTFHIEATNTPEKLIKDIRRANMRVGVALNPDTPVTALQNILSLTDFVLVMTVQPGFGGQGFIPESIEKIAALNATIQAQKLTTPIHVDGGINANTIGGAVQAGASFCVAGSAVYNERSVIENIAVLKSDEVASCE